MHSNSINTLRSEDLIISECLTQDFCSSSRRGNRRIAGYATVSTTQMTDKKTSQEADIIKSSLLSQKHLENQYRFFLDASSAMMWVADTQGKLIFFNSSWLQYTGRDLENELQHDWTGEEIHADDYQSCLETYTSGFLTTSVFEQEFRLLRHDGEYRWFHETVKPFFDLDEHLSGFVGTCIDITERKQAILLANDELRKKYKDLEQFAYVASHDLQEPLRKIQSFSDLLTTRFSRDLPDKAQDYLQRMHKASTRMRVLIDDLLTFSRVNSRGNPFKATSLKKIIEDVLSDLEIRIKETKARIIVEDLPVIDCDPTQISQLFQNLICNSLKFHRDKTPPVINITSRKLSDSELERTHCEKEMIEFSFIDNGIGFDEKYLDRIFEPFQRLHGNNKYQGSGIGLAVCKKVVERHGGLLFATSKLGEGACFQIQLPFEQKCGENPDV